MTKSKTSQTHCPDCGCEFVEVEGYHSAWDHNIYQWECPNCHYEVYGKWIPNRGNEK